MKRIPLTQGYFALVDDVDYERIAKYKWTAATRPKTVYAKRGENGITYLLHRFVLGITNSNTGVDHEDHNGLNCQRYNLRIATKSQNSANTGLRATNTSGYKGVVWDKSRKKWRAQIGFKKPINLGRYANAEEAALAYDRAALKYFGEFSLTNLKGRENNQCVNH